jgi:prepilin-type N-terminal cleavage/methylation domain-containing protein
MKLHLAKRTAFTLVEIMIVVAIIGLLAAIALPNFVKARTKSQTNACIENLTKIDGAKHTWAIETKQVSSSVPVESDLFGPTSYIRDTPSCPASGLYTLNDVATKPTCNVAGHSF